jgi:hypothetical protein
MAFAPFFIPAIADSTTLSFFSSINNQFFGPTLDNVRVQLVMPPPVPEPGDPVAARDRPRWRRRSSPRRATLSGSALVRGDALDQKG